MTQKFGIHTAEQKSPNDTKHVFKRCGYYDFILKGNQKGLIEMRKIQYDQEVATHFI